MTLKSNEQLNAESPELRDVIVVVDGLNVLDLNIAPGARAPRYSVQLSGDMGVTPNGMRAVYGHAAQVLNYLIEKGFSAHANVSRDDLDNDIAHATSLMKQAVAALTTAGEDISLHCHALSIWVTTCDFNLTEMRLLSGEAMDKVEFLLEQPAEPSDALTELMTRKRKNLVREDLGETTPVTTSLGTTTTIMIGDELHVRREFNDEDGEAIIVWIPSELNQGINNWNDVDKDKLSFHGGASEGHPTFILNRHAVKGNADQSPV